MSQSIRSFLAFDIESDQVKKKLSHAQTLLLQTGADLKLVETGNIHVTIKFLGNVTPSIIDRIHYKMKAVQFTSFDIQIRALGAFPNIQYPRVVWAGIGEGANQLRDVFNQLESKLCQMGFPPEPKGFSAHLTIARVRSGRNKAQLSKFLADNAGYEFGLIRAECLRLKQSDLTPSGPVYSTLREFCPSP
jgi:2'-5' RNA ligase